jgi:hypothetical protein
MQLGMYESDSKSETYEKKMYRLNQKWLIEAEIWLVFLILVELCSIYKLVIMDDQRTYVAEKMGLTPEQMKIMENKLE